MGQEDRERTESELTVLCGNGRGVPDARQSLPRLLVPGETNRGLGNISILDDEKRAFQKGQSGVAQLALGQIEWCEKIRISGMNLLPRDDKFFKYFQHQVKLICHAADLLVEGAASGNAHLANAAHQIHVLEEEADDVLHEIYTHLNSTFITPLDPEDKINAGGTATVILKTRNLNVPAVTRLRG